VALQGPIKLYEFISTAYKVQEINLEWLIDTVQKNYVLISKSINRVYVKKDLVPYMESLGWKKVTQ
jgi:transketolase N-terminal domain/subunit